MQVIPWLVCFAIATVVSIVALVIKIKLFRTHFSVCGIVSSCLNTCEQVISSDGEGTSSTGRRKSRLSGHQNLRSTIRGAVIVVISFIRWLMLLLGMKVCQDESNDSY